METSAHHMLKRLALRFLRSEGYRACAREVRVPGSRYRADAAGWLDRLPLPSAHDDRGGLTLWAGLSPAARSPARRRCAPRTIIIECKQSRPDFIRDDRDAERLLALRTEAEQWRAHLEEHRIKPHEPELRESGSSLFPGLETWNFEATRLKSYHRLLVRIARLEDMLYGDTKFHFIARYRLADRLFLAAPRGMVRRREVPPGWGLLECARDDLRVGDDDHAGAAGEPASFSVAVPAPDLASRPDRRAHLLRNIAVAATRDSLARFDRANHGATQPSARLPVQSARPDSLDLHEGDV